MFLPETLAKQFNIFVTNAVAKFSKLTGEGDRTYFRFIGDSGRRVTNGHGSNCVFVVVNRLNILSTLTIQDPFLNNFFVVVVNVHRLDRVLALSEIFGDF